MAADGHGANRVERAIGGHNLGDFTVRDLGGLEIQIRIFRTLDVGDSANGSAAKDDQDHQPPAEMRFFCAGHRLPSFLNETSDLSDACKIVG